MGALIHLFNLGILGASEDDKSGSLLEQDRKFPKVAILGRRYLTRLGKRRFEMGERLGIGRTSNGAIACTLVIKA